MTPSDSCYRNERTDEAVSDQPEWLATKGEKKTTTMIPYIVQHNVRDFSQSRTFIPHVLFEVQEQRRVFFQLLQGEHVFQDDDSTVLVRLIAEFVRHRERRTELVLRVPILQFPESPR